MNKPVKWMLLNSLYRILEKPKNAWEWLIGRISEEDARKTYFAINQEFHDLLQNIKEGYWYVRPKFSNFERLEQEGITKLLPKTLLSCIEDLLQKKDEFEELRKKSDKKLSSLFENFYEDAPYDDEGLLPKVYRTIFRKQVAFENFSSEIFKFNKEQFEELKKEVNDDKEIHAFLLFKDKIEREINKLLKDIISSYKHDVLMPERRKTVLAIATIILTAILGWSTISSTITSNRLVEKQLELTPPLNPEIRFFPSDRDDLFIRAEDIAQPTSYFDDRTIKEWRKERLYLIFQNIGQLPAGYVRAEIKNPILHIIPDSESSIENLDSRTSQGLAFKIWLEGCSQLNTDAQCNRSLVPLGIQKLNLSIKCQYCEEESTDILTICIYNISKENDCNNFG